MACTAGCHWAAFIVTNEVHLYGSRVTRAPEAKIRVQGIHSCSIAPGRAPYKVGAYIPGGKNGEPAFARLFTFEALADISPEIQPIGQATFMRCDTVSWLWSGNGKAVIVRADTDRDAKGQSYYGESGLYYMTGTGKENQSIHLDKEGPIHDIQWAPSGRDFIAIYGFVPGKATLFGEKCKPKFEFGSVAHNTVIWSPHGRFVCLAGFGSLNGDMDFWDMNKLKKMGSANSRPEPYR